MFRKTLFTAAALCLGLMAGSASAGCSDPAEDGGWRNINPATDSITRVRVNYSCRELRNVWLQPEVSWSMHLWGACTPRDCDWGTARARRLDTGWLHAHYDQGYAKRDVYARMVGGGRLRVTIRTDFTDPARPDYTSDNYFVQP